MMYFGLWLVVFVIHWLRKIKHGVNLQGRNRVASYRMSLMAHLVDTNNATATDDIDDDNTGASSSSSSSPSSTSSTLKMLCRRFRFLRAFEFLLLFSYETLVEQALQLVNCIGVGSCGRVLAEFPDVACPNNSKYISLLVVATLLLIYAVAFPVGLFVFLRKLNLSDKDSSGSSAEQLPKLRHTTEQRSRELAQAKFGVFFDHFKPQFWWWEIVVSCIDLNVSDNFPNSNTLATLQVLARRVLTLVVYVSQFTLVTERAYGILVVSLIIMALHFGTYPFKELSDNILESISLTMLVYAAGTKAVFPNGGEIFFARDIVPRSFSSSYQFSFWLDG